ncbi:ALQxL family class IV lanthipeptide [Acrocarpospora sp. B8E8]
MTVDVNALELLPAEQKGLRRCELSCGLVSCVLKTCVAATKIEV